MPESNLLESGKIISFFLGIGITILGLFAKLQTKGGCKKAHTEYEKLQKLRRENQKVKDDALNEKLDGISDDVKALTVSFNQMKKDLYEPRVAEFSRRRDL